MPNFITSYFNGLEPLDKDKKDVILGSKSVCPYVENVAYAVKEPEAHAQYQWTVEGGQIVKGQGHSSIEVNWGATNAHAEVRVVHLNQLGCPVDTASMTVRINVELATEIPSGEDSICLNHAKNNTYSTTNTHGSVYTWGIEGGEIMSGQGTHEVVIDWLGTGQHQLWVQEKSVTIDTICYGISDTLQVFVFDDPTAIDLQYVNVENEKVVVHWQLNELHRQKDSLLLFRREKDTDEWVLIARLPSTTVQFIDENVYTDLMPYDYRLQTTNACGEVIEVPAHHTILLTGKADQSNDQVHLQWNAYGGWEAGVSAYEVLRSIDEADTLELIAVVDAGTLSYDTDGKAGFNHHFKIKAISAEGNYMSWSNDTTLTFEHVLFIPNVITPNDDGKNDTFELPKLELYPENELSIFNRTGKEIFHQSGYQGGFDGHTLPAGTYYYSLFLRKTNKTHKGWLHIFKQ